MKNVLLDTSLLNRVEENVIDLEEIFPNFDYVRWAHHIPVAEFLFDKHGELQDKTGGPMFFEKFNLHTFFGDFIILEEYLHEQNEIVSNLKPDLELTNHRERSLVSLRAGEKVGQERCIKNGLLYEKNKNRSLWRKIPISQFKEVTINFGQLLLRVGESFNNRDEWKMIMKILLEEPIKEVIKNKNKGNFHALYQKISTFSRTKNEDEISEALLLQYFNRSMIDIEHRLPASYNMMVIYVFISFYLRRPMSIKERKPENQLDEFKIRITPEIQLKNCRNQTDLPPLTHIAISENLRPDLLSTVKALHYVDIFATCDKNQAAILMFLYPKYSDKIKWFSAHDKA